jgi:hypothetical protein
MQNNTDTIPTMWLLFIAILTESSLPPDSDARHYRSVSRFGDGQSGGPSDRPAERVAP